MTVNCLPKYGSIRYDEPAKFSMNTLLDAFGYNTRTQNPGHTPKPVESEVSGNLVQTNA